MMLELAGGGNVILYNGKKGVSAVVSGQVTNQERTSLEEFLRARGLFRSEGGDLSSFVSNPSGESEGQAKSHAVAQQSGHHRPPLFNLSGASGAWIGSDEAGKGDYFGPLVVAAVHVNDEASLGMLGAAGVRDSKLVGNTEAVKLSEWIRKNLQCESLVVMPVEYNVMYGGNLNILLAKLHARAVAKLAARTGAGVCVTDQFARPQLLQHELRALDYRGRVFQRTKGEADGAVAAASVLARGLYLSALRDLSGEFTVELTPGAGPPVLEAGRELVRLFGPGVLEKVGKLHFKTTQDILMG
jgi:ribonuclease HIII